MEAFTEDMKTKLNDSRLQKCFEDLIQPNTPYLTWLVGINHRNETMYDINVIFLTYLTMIIQAFQLLHSQGFLKIK